MQKNAREREIINKLKSSDGFVSTSELCCELFASESSIRRDLASLEAKGIIKRVYGGCEPVVNHSGAIAFGSRAATNAQEKRQIAKKAAAFIKDGDVIFLDQSSSAYYLAEEIKNNATLTIVTNNIQILVLLSSSRMKVISSGGRLCDGNRSCLVGSDAERTFREIFADILFFSTRSVSADGVVSDTVSEEVAVRRCMLENAGKKIYLCDSSKLGSRSAFKQCELRELDAIVSDTDEMTSYLGARNII